MAERMIGSREAAEIVGVSQTYINRMAATGRIRSVRWGGVNLFTMSALKKFKATRRN